MREKKQALERHLSLVGDPNDEKEKQQASLSPGTINGQGQNNDVHDEKDQCRVKSLRPVEEEEKNEPRDETVSDEE